MSKHTPGPWRIRELINGTAAIYGAGEYDIVFPKLHVMSYADSRLIAAAPEMLEALEEAARWLDNDGDYTLNDTLCETKYDCVRVILAAIAKAKGE